MAQQPLTRPPQQFPHGARRLVDGQWLAYVTSTGDVGDGASLARSEPLQRGIAEFNEGRFRESHETWEELWKDTPYPERLFLLALTKLGAGFAHALRRNEKGMRSQLTEATRILRAFAPAYAGVDTQRLIVDVNDRLAHGEGHFGPPFPAIARADVDA
ncbi:MAG: DUF309 domain-containing protein [Chloroflexota bacterium]|nr:DUF309 domain-containing protein [Chloroflexota bacterium]MDE2885635.1 DUF309 domain-containing protein [Chloroflexota bacterium]